VRHHRRGTRPVSRVRGNPAVRIADVEKVVTVFKDGLGYDSKKLIDAVRGEIGLR
jgi:hypothetical protein